MVISPKQEQSEQITADSQTARLFAWRRGFNAMHVIDLGIQLGLFKSLDTPNPKTATEIARQLGLHPPYVAVWCTTAFSFELLEADEEERFRLAPFVREILADPTHPRYLGGYVQLGTQFATEDYRFAVDAFRDASVAPFQGRNRVFAEMVAQAIWGVNVMVARKILPGLPGISQALNGGGSLLELGCGTGTLLLQIADTFPNAHCTGVDIDPSGLSIARSAVSEAELGDRLTLLEGDVGKVVGTGAFDVVIMVEVLHEISPDIRPSVISGCANALRDGGYLVIIDETYPSTLPESREPDYLFPVQTGMEELMWGNVIPTRDEQERLLQEAGFNGEIARSMLGAGFTLITTQKTA